MNEASFIRKRLVEPAGLREGVLLLVAVGAGLCAIESEGMPRGLLVAACVLAAAVHIRIRWHRARDLDRSE
jgi:hypothetical protein